MTCKTVIEHQNKNNGSTDLEWLEDHVKLCKQCQEILETISHALFDTFDTSLE